jgi:hypothetical protein
MLPSQGNIPAAVRTSTVWTLQRCAKEGKRLPWYDFIVKSTNYLAALVLFLLPAISVELLTGNTPLPQYAYPITFVILNLTYGATLLLIRETVVRWGKGFTSVLVLAAGYGMVNEAIDTKGFFAPHFYAVVGQGMEGFGRAFGINVPWAINISIFHAVFSIIVPLIIVSAIFRNPGPWIGNKLYAALIVAVVACSAFSFKVLSLPPDFYHYQEGPGPIILILAIMAALILLAWKLPTFRTTRWSLRPHALFLFVLGSVSAFVYHFFPQAVQTATGSVTVFVAFILVFFVAIPLVLYFKLQEPTAVGKVALAAGLLMFMMLTSPQRGPGSLFATGILALLIAVALWRSGRTAAEAVPL